MLNGLVPPLITASAAAILLWCRQIYVRRQGQRWPADVAAAIGIVCVTALLELSMGRTLVYRNGPIRPWVSEVHSDQNSQQITDWYTFSHIIHGAIFYGATHWRWDRRRWACVPPCRLPSKRHGSPTRTPIW